MAVQPFAFMASGIGDATGEVFVLGGGKSTAATFKKSSVSSWRLLRLLPWETRNYLHHEPPLGLISRFGHAALPEGDLSRPRCARPHPCRCGPHGPPAHVSRYRLREGVRYRHPLA